MDKNSLTWWTSQLDDIWKENIRMIHPNKNLDQACKESFGELMSSELRLQNADISDFKKLVNRWLCNMRPETNTKPQVKWKI